MAMMTATVPGGAATAPEATTTNDPSPKPLCHPDIPTLVWVESRAHAHLDEEARSPPSRPPQGPPGPLLPPPRG